MARLTPTSFAILAYLAYRPWSAYELNKQMQDAARLSWTRTESRIYQEPKNLVAHGLATATEEVVNGRKRTVYAITDAGRAELAAWFDRESTPPVHEFEALLKIGFAEFGSRAATLADLARTEQQVRQIMAHAWDSFPRYVERVGADPERLHNLFLYGKFVSDYVALMIDWTRWAREQIEKRPDDWAQGAADRILGFTTPANLAAPDPDLPA